MLVEDDVHELMDELRDLPVENGVLEHKVAGLSIAGDERAVVDLEASLSFGRHSQGSRRDLDVFIVALEFS